MTPRVITNIYILIQSEDEPKPSEIIIRQEELEANLSKTLKEIISDSYNIAEVDNDPTMDS